MVIKIKVKNADKYVLLDHEVFEALNSLTLFQEYHVLDHIREHSSGVPVFQKYINNTAEGKLKVETIYLAHFIAKKYIPHPESKTRMFLNFLNGDKLDLRLKNLKWESMKMVKRAPRNTNHDKAGLGGETLSGKTKRRSRKNHENINHSENNGHATPLEVKLVNLLPAHFAPLRKKRTPKARPNEEDHQPENDSPMQELKSAEQLIPHENNS